MMSQVMIDRGIRERAADALLRVDPADPPERLHVAFDERELLCRQEISALRYFPVKLAEKISELRRKHGYIVVEAALRSHKLPVPIDDRKRTGRLAQ